jgi:hypothetical protein
MAKDSLPARLRKPAVARLPLYTVQGRQTMVFTAELWIVDSRR